MAEVVMYGEVKGTERVAQVGLNPWERQPFHKGLTPVLPVGVPETA